MVLQLIKKEPRKRPAVAIVSYHPYFALANENTNANFVEKMKRYFNKFPKNENPYSDFFSEENLRIWENMIRKEKNPMNSYAMEFLVRLTFSQNTLSLNFLHFLMFANLKQIRRL